MIGVLCGRQYRSRAYMATGYLGAVIAAGAAVSLPSVHAQSLFGFGSPAPAPAAQPAPAAAEPASTQRAAVPHRRRHARELRAHRPPPVADVDASDLAKEGQQGGLGERVNANTVAVVSGSLESTDASVAADLSTVLDDGDNLRILPVIGKGGGQAIRDVRFMKGVDLGIAPVNLLNEYRRTNRIGPIDDTIVYVTKLFNEEMHVLVRADSPVATLAQLSGQRVDFGEPGSGTQIAARDVFARLGIRAEEVAMDQAAALRKLASGEIAAAVVLAGKPASAIAKLRADGFRLLPVPYPKELQGEYLPASLGSQDYPTMIAPGAQIDTLAVGTVLIAYNWPRGSDGYRRIEKFVDAFFPRLAQFQAPPRHPKWQEVNLTAVLPGWTRFAAAEEWLQRGRQQVDGGGRRIEDAMAAREATSGKGVGATPQEVDRLFHEFLKWNQTRERR
jgi:uncharacterized protein